MNDRKPEDPNKLDELAAREARAKEMGGADKIARQLKGRLTARDRIEKLLDQGSFDGRALLAVSDLPEAADKTPAARGCRTSWAAPA